MNKIKPINIMNKFSLFNEKWTPKIIAELNDQHIKVCKLIDDFVWHSHENEDELFMVFKGTLLMEFRDGRIVKIKQGQFIKISSTAHSILIEPNIFINLFLL